MFFGYGIVNIEDNIKEIVCCRNYIIHSGKEKIECKNILIKKPNQDHILTWFKMLKTILEKINEGDK